MQFILLSFLASSFFLRSGSAEDFCDEDLTDLHEQYIRGQNHNEVKYNLHLSRKCPCESKPKPTVISVLDQLSEDVNYSYISHKYVLVFRCKGTCSHSINLSCHPRNESGVSFKNFTVKVRNRRNELSAESFFVEEHSEPCGCVCPLNQEKCGPHRKFIEEKCLCLCKNGKMARKCARTFGSRWDKEYCQCLVEQTLGQASFGAMVTLCVFLAVVTLIMVYLFWERRRFKRALRRKRIPELDALNSS